MTTRRPTKNVVVVGGGMCGPLMAIYLARRGHTVQIFERREDPRLVGRRPRRSIKMTLAQKGLHALQQVGLVEEVLEQTIPLRGRAVHDEKGHVSYQLYGNGRHEVIHSITRTDLNVVLLRHLERYPQISARFGHRCVHLDKNEPAAVFQKTDTGERARVSADVVIGADGANSPVRRFMQFGQRADFHQEFLHWGYKALTIVPDEQGRHQMDPNALHIWPRGDFILFALPSLDGSFNAVCTLPFEGATSFVGMKTDRDVLELFDRWFPDATPLIPNLFRDFRNHPVSRFLTIRTSRWHSEDKVVLMGDACHTVVPFYGQGMNAALADCAALDRAIGRHPDDWSAAFAEYQALRKPHTDTLAELSHRNFTELRDTARSPLVTARKKASLWLNRRFPTRYVPVYTLVTHSTLPYRDCVERAERQDRVLSRYGFDVVVWALALGIGLRRVWRRLGARLAARGRGDGGDTVVTRSKRVVGPGAGRPAWSDDDEVVRPVYTPDKAVGGKH